MKSKVFEYMAIITWVLLVFYWAIYTDIPKRSMEYLLKTLPLIILGIYAIDLIFKKFKRKN